MSNLLVISIAAPDDVFRNQRLYLKAHVQNAFDVQIAATSDASYSGARLEVDFGRMLTEVDVERIVQATQGLYTASKIGGASILVLTPAGDTLSLKKQAPLKIPIAFSRIEGPGGKPYGTILLSLKQGTAILAAAEFDVTMARTDRDLSATPPVIVMWDNDNNPTLPPGQPNSVTFAVINARFDRRGNAKDLVTESWKTEDGDALAPRIRLSIPPALRKGNAVSFNSTKDFFRQAALEFKASNPKQKWTAEKQDAYQELVPDRNDISIIEANGHLKVTVSNLATSNPGHWSLAVTFIDFPGYDAATFLLPLEVSGTFEIQNFTARKVPWTSYGKWKLEWKIAGDTTWATDTDVQLEFSECGDLMLDGNTARQIERNLGHMGTRHIQSSRSHPMVAQLLVRKRGCLVDARQLLLPPIPPLTIACEAISDSSGKECEVSWTVDSADASYCQIIGPGNIADCDAAPKNEQLPLTGKRTRLGIDDIFLVVRDRTHWVIDRRAIPFVRRLFVKVPPLTRDFTGLGMGVAHSAYTQFENSINSALRDNPKKIEVYSPFYNGEIHYFIGDRLIGQPEWKVLECRPGQAIRLSV